MPYSVCRPAATINVSGWVVIVDPVNIKPVTKMNAAEAMKFAVSGGITSTLDENKNELP